MNQIKDMIEKAVAASGTVYIDYTDSVGNRTVGRKFTPDQVSVKADSVDVFGRTDDGYRHFKLANISKVTTTPPIPPLKPLSVHDLIVIKSPITGDIPAVITRLNGHVAAVCLGSGYIGNLFNSSVEVPYSRDQLTEKESALITGNRPYSFVSSVTINK
jgi:hypothetical protein